MFYYNARYIRNENEANLKLKPFREVELPPFPECKFLYSVIKVLSINYTQSFPQNQDVPYYTRQTNEIWLGNNLDINCIAWSGLSSFLTCTLNFAVTTRPYRDRLLNDFKVDSMHLVKGWYDEDENDSNIVVYDVAYRPIEPFISERISLNIFDNFE